MERGLSGSRHAGAMKPAEGGSRRGVAIGLALVVVLGAVVGVVARNGRSRSEPKQTFQWERAELAADGQTLTLSYLGGRCVGDNSHIEGGHPTFRVDDRGDVVVVTLRGDKLIGNGICAGVGLGLSATVVLPRAVEPAVIADGACDPHNPRGATWLRYRSRNPLPTDPPPDDPCVPGSPRVRSAVPDTCTNERTPAGAPRVAPSVTLEPNGDGVKVAIDLNIGPGGACHLDDFYSPDIFINPGIARHEFRSTPSWGTAFRADVGTNGGRFRAEWNWANWCGPDSDVYASVATLSPGNVGQVKSNTRPPCHVPAAPNVLTISQPFRRSWSSAWKT